MPPAAPVAGRAPPEQCAGYFFLEAPARAREPEELVRARELVALFAVPRVVVAFRAVVARPFVAAVVFFAVEPLAFFAVVARPFDAAVVFLAVVARPFVAVAFFAVEPLARAVVFLAVVVARPFVAVAFFAVVARPFAAVVFFAVVARPFDAAVVVFAVVARPFDAVDFADDPLERAVVFFAVVARPVDADAAVFVRPFDPSGAGLRPLPLFASDFGDGSPLPTVLSPFTRPTVFTAARGAAERGFVVRVFCCARGVSARVGAGVFVKRRRFSTPRTSGIRCTAAASVLTCCGRLTVPRR